MLCPTSASGHSSDRFQHRRGIAAVEFAVVLPFLAILVLGIVEFGRVLHIRQVLNDAVRKGCRLGIYPNRSSAAITSEINNILSDNSIGSGSATITILVNGQKVDASTAVKNDQVSVSVSVPFSQLSWGPVTWLSGSASLSATLVMQRQG